MKSRLAQTGLAAIAATAILTAQGASSSPQGTVFRATTNYVSTDVRVRDKTGRFVPDLRADEFKVYEDGVLQKITTFTPVIGGRIMSSLAVNASVPVPAGEGLILPPSRPNTDASGRIFIIFIDDLHFQPSETPQVKQLLGTIRDTLVHDNDLVGFVSTGTSTVEINPNYDFGHRRFNEAIEKTMGSAPSVDDIVKNARFETGDGPMQMRFNAHTAFRTAYDMLEQLGQITDRRKSFIYVSNGYTYDPFTESRFKRIMKDYEELGLSGTSDSNSDSSDGDSSNQKKQSELSPYDGLADPEYRRRTEFAESDLTQEVAQLVRDARRNNVAFYTVDPRGLTANMMDASQSEQISYAEWRDFITQTQGTLRVLGDETGGFCICNTNDFKAGLQRIDNETSDYYLIGYTSSNPDPLKIRRTIKIEVSRPAVEQIIYRDSYTIPRVKRK
jgi:VWFA-related protein